jgi:phage host-nuclease inhibitor protein Gam
MDSCVQLLIRRQGSVERHSLQLPIDSNDTVGDISDKVAKKLEILHPSTMKIIFCGRRLTNEMAVKDLRLGPQT